MTCFEARKMTSTINCCQIASFPICWVSNLTFREGPLCQSLMARAGHLATLPQRPSPPWFEKSSFQALLLYSQTSIPTTVTQKPHPVGLLWDSQAFLPPANGREKIWMMNIIGCLMRVLLRASFHALLGKCPNHPNLKIFVNKYRPRDFWYLVQNAAGFFTAQFLF